MIIFRGGQIDSRGNPGAAPLIVTDEEARINGWRDFRDGLTVEERGFFTMPGANGVLGLTPEGVRHAHGPGSRRTHLHVLRMLRAAETPTRRIFVLPMPVFQVMPAAQAWVTPIAVGTHGNQGFRITINGYGAFPSEWVDLRTALGRTHHASVASPVDAVVYGTTFGNNPVDPQVAAQWNRLSQAGQLVAVRPGDTAASYIAREDTVTLFHELLVHAIWGVAGHGSMLDEAVEARATQNWLAHH